MSRHAKEMVSVEVFWHSGWGLHWLLTKYPDAFYFTMKRGKIERINTPKSAEEAPRFYGAMIFTPIPSGNNYPINPYISELDCEVDLVGADEAFGAGDDIETIALWAFWRYQDGNRCGPYQSFIALYDVYSYVYRDNNGGKDSETEYQLLGILDTDKLPLALAETQKEQ